MTAKPKIPRHVAIIMDGNGRWAESQGKRKLEGHKAGADALRRCVESARNLGIEIITAYAFSTENWSRPKAEVLGLMNLLRAYLKNDINKLIKDDVRLRVIGDRSRLDDDITRLIEDAEARTAENESGTLVLALNYGGRDEILNAVRTLAARCADGGMNSDDINAESLSACLYTYDIPDPDLIIRTSGERRLSNFLLWQAAYSEFWFTDVLWPDFSEETLWDAVKDFASRERRYGGRPRELLAAEQETEKDGAHG